jgi:hypothetical protein
MKRYSTVDTGWIGYIYRKLNVVVSWVEVNEDVVRPQLDITYAILNSAFCWSCLAP